MKDNWKYVTLSDFVDLKHGYQFRDTDFTENGIPIIKIGNVWEKGLNLENVTFISKKRYDIFKSYEIMNGDILMSLTGNIGRVVEVKGLSSVVLQNYRVGNFFSKDETVLGKQFIKWILGSKSLLEQLDRYSNQSAQANFGKQDLDKLKFYLPPIPQQRKIATILSTCDQVIEKTEAAIAKYQALKQGMMHDLFTRGVDVKTGKLRPKCQDAPELYKESELGMIPKDWEVYEIGKLTKLVTDGSHFSPIPQEKGMPIGNVKDMLDSTFNYDACTKINPEVFELLTRQNCSPKRGDVLLSKDGTVGKVIHFEDNQQIVLLSSIAIIRVNELIESTYLAWALRSEIFDKALYSLLSGSALKRITLKDIQKIKIPFSKSLEEQQFVASRLKTIENKLQTEQTALAKYQHLKAGLMQDLLTGKVEVNVAEEILKN
jgi:type I restriction enzyme S subunit